MSYHTRKGLHSPLIEVGCPFCDIHFFYAAKDKEEVEGFPHMGQRDWLRLTKKGFMLTKKPEEVDNNLLPMLDKAMAESASGQTVDRGSFAKYVKPRVCVC